ncbi:MAG TPA: ABC transporter substrate-binding protein, partial [Ktedonobacteraceae bacterium]
MSIRHRTTSLCSIFALMLPLLLVACGQQAPATGSTGSSSASLKNVSIGLGYVPDIQFAPFYVAQSKGYYKAVGLNVTFHHGVVPDLIGSMVAGKNDFVFAGGDELLEARDKGVSAVDVGAVFQKYPVSLIVPQDSSVKSLAD